MYRPVTVKEIIEKSAEKFRYNCAFTFLDSEGKKTEINYKRLKRDVDCLSLAFLREYKLQGEKVAIISCNCYEWCVTYLACLCSGIVERISTASGSGAGEDIEDILSFASVTTVVCDSQTLMKLKGVTAYRTVCIQDFENGFYPLLEKGENLLREGFSHEVKIEPDALAVLLFTSGTTGNPKGVMLSNTNLCSDLFLVRENIRVSETDRSLSLLPLHHTYEAIALLMMLYCGGSIAFCGGIRYLGKSFSVFKPTVFVTVPLVLERLHSKITGEIEEKGKRQKFRLAALVSSAISNEKKKKIFSDIHTFFGGRLKNIIVGAAALQQSVAEDFELFGFNVIIGYGLTECSPIIICNSVEERTTDTVGRPLSEVQLKIDCPDEKGVGEILVKGPMVMLGYYENKEATDEVFRNGWFCTGDLGFETEDTVSAADAKM